MAKKVPNRKVGAAARSASLTVEQRKAIAAKAASARWSKPTPKKNPKSDQLEFELIPHKMENTLVLQRAVDGYVNATAMCQASGKRFNDYMRVSTTVEFLEELSSVAGIPATALVVTNQGGRPELQGIWVHPDVAIHLGQWCSPKFAVAVARWVREWMTGKAKAGLPYHIRRYMANMSEVPHGHFSILNEVIFTVIGPLEAKGYVLPDTMVPDISQGRMFCRWLREEKGLDTDALPTYRHSYEDGRVVFPKAYPLSVLIDFRNYVAAEWLPKEATRYFAERSPEALPYLREVLATLPAPKDIIAGLVA